ncbi:MAG TPA: SCO family protein [Candidatus Acidoferrales bacterium]|nr:SCO family protein [Candidatus Acidoferrales bacterium]
MTNTRFAAGSQWRGRLLLLALASLFFGPLFLASLWYRHADRWPLPQQRANHGELLLPIQTLAEVRLTDLDGRPLTPKMLRGRWSLVYLGGPECNADCQHFLYQIRQVRTALGKETERVQRLYLLRAPPPDSSSLRALSGLHPDLVVAILSSPELAEQIRRAHASEDWSGANLYLVDPLGNLVLRYGADQEPKGVLTDLRRLLRLSHVG